MYWGICPGIWKERVWAVTQVTKLWRRCRYCEGNGQRRPAFLPWSSSLKKDWENAKKHLWAPWVFERHMINFRRWVIFPVVIFASLMLCCVEVEKWKLPWLILNCLENGLLKTMLPKLNRRWVFSDRIHDLLKLSTDRLLSRWMRVYKESLDDFKACSDWHNDEAGADFWQAFLVACQ